MTELVRIPKVDNGKQKLASVTAIILRKRRMMFENKMWNQDIARLKELIETYGVSEVLEEIAKIIRKSQKEKYTN